MDLFRRHPAIALACFVWAAYALLETWIASGAVMMATTWALHGLVLMLVMKACLDRAPSNRPLARLAIFIAAPAVFAVLQTMLDMLSTQLVGHWALRDIPQPPTGVISPMGVRFDFAFKLNLRVYLWIFGFYAATVALLGAIRDTFTARLQAERAELEALRLQVNPHLLFNALNSISSLIIRNEHDRAETMTLGLARFYRLNLTTEASNLVPVRHEIESVEAYVQLEQLRLDRLSLQLECQEALWDAGVPSMILQPLVENAIKYGVSGADDPAPVRLEIRRSGDRLEIIIENGLSENPETGGSGIGLRNVRSRLQSLFGDNAEVRTERGPDGWRVALALPFALAHERDEPAPGPNGAAAVSPSAPEDRRDAG